MNSREAGFESFSSRFVLGEFIHTTEIIVEIDRCDPGEKGRFGFSLRDAESGCRGPCVSSRTGVEPVVGDIMTCKVSGDWTWASQARSSVDKDTRCIPVSRRLCRFETASSRTRGRIHRHCSVSRDAPCPPRARPTHRRPLRRRKPAILMQIGQESRTRSPPRHPPHSCSAEIISHESRSSSKKGASGT